MKLNTLQAVVAVFFVILLFVNGSPAQTWVHPGILNSQTDLIRMRQGVAGGVSPWKDSYAQFSLDPYSLSTYTASPVATVTMTAGHYHPFEYDATAAYQNALMWYITGNVAYATNAIAIVNGWATTLQSYDPTGDITAYDVSLKMSAAAEILRYETGSGWTSTNTTNLSNMLTTKLYPALINSSGGMVADDGNQGIGSIRGLMAMAIFTENRTLYNTAINLYEGNSNTIDPCVAVTYYIDPYGSSGESGRDQVHPQDALASYAESAKMAEIQGTTDLWGYSGNRLMLGFEYIAEYNLGNTVNWSNHGTCNTSYGSLSGTDRGYFNMMYEMAYQHYAVGNGLSMPYSAQVLGLTRAETGAIDDPGYGTLLYTLDAGPAPVFDGTYNVAALVSHLSLETAGGQTGPNTQVEQATYTGSTTQQWEAVSVGNETYKFYPKAGTFANVVDSGSLPSAANEDSVLYTNNGHINQMWKVASSGPGYVVLSRDTILMDLPITNLYWDITGDSSSPGALLEMEPADGKTDQQFTLSPVYPKIQASSYSGQSGTQLENSSEGGEDVCFINNGDWTAYKGVNVAGSTAIDLRVATPNVGGTIEIHEGSVTGTLLGTATVNTTGGWQTYGTVTASIAGASGTQNIYLVYKGAGGGSLFNLLWFLFK
jgi:hypothetical protein